MTAMRYGRILRQLGHRVDVELSYTSGPCDVLIGLHARRSAPSIREFVERHPNKPLVLVLTGTDLYHDIRIDAEAQRSLDLATRLVVLQRMGLAELPGSLQSKARVIYQSCPPFRGQAKRPTTYFRVAVIGHLRPEKDPLRTAAAARLLASSSLIRVVQVGAALSPDLGAAAREEAAQNPRYRWTGALPHWRARGLLASSHLVAITSIMEGSSNVLGEALTSPTPVVASRISGLIGTLGDDYPGYFPVGDTRALAELLGCAESDPGFYESLRAYGQRAAALVAPETESEAWRSLLAELA